MSRTNKPMYVVDDESGCWIWQRSQWNGYGKMCVKIDGEWRPYYAHVYFYEKYVAPRPEGYDIHHTCENPSCVNPEHLVAEPHGSHMRRSAIKRWNKLTEDNVRDIRRRYAAGGVTQTALAASWGVSQVAISLVVTRKNWADVD